MDKIPTLFERGEDFKVIDKVRAGCEWVAEHEGLATEKLDGTNVRLTIRSGQVVRVEKRRNPSKSQKLLRIKDAWYVDAHAGDANDKWIFEAVISTDVGEWPDGEHSTEAVGPNIQGNPLGLEKHVCVPFNMSMPHWWDAPRSYDGLKEFLHNLDSLYSPGHHAEGIVFHHPDGHRAKIKRKDFPLIRST